MPVFSTSEVAEIGGGKDEAGDFVLEDFCGGGDFTIDVTEDEIAKSTHGLEAFVTFTAHANHDCRSLCAAVSIFWNGYSVSNFLFLVGGDGSLGFVNRDPISNIGVLSFFIVVWLVSFAFDTIWCD